VTSDALDINTTSSLLGYIYNSYRMALLNRMYFSAKLRRYRNYNSCMEMAIAVGTTGSGGIAGLAIWGSITGQYAWLIISGIATVLGVIKPVLQFGKEIEKYSNFYSGYSSVYFDLEHIVQDIAVSRSVPPEIAEKYESILTRLAGLGVLHDSAPSDKVLISKLQAQVNEAIPLDKLWFPAPAPLRSTSLVQKS
jgi:hypothetical protein